MDFLSILFKYPNTYCTTLGSRIYILLTDVRTRNNLTGC
jgi:hypothetical protein